MTTEEQLMERSCCIGHVHTAQNGDQEPDPPAEHVQDQQADPRLVSGYIYY